MTEMNQVASEGAQIAWRSDGPINAPTILFSNSLGTDHRMWDPQLERLSDRFRILRYDTRGHGQSDAPSGPYELEQLGRDALAVLDAAGVQRVFVCGLSLGGLTAMWLAANHPDRVERAVLANTGAKLGDDERWRSRIETVKTSGIAGMKEATIERFLSQTFRSANPRPTQWLGDIVLGTSEPGYIGCCGALKSADLREQVANIQVPVTIIVGSEDQSTPVSMSEELKRRIPGSELFVLDGAAHISNVEQPDRFSEILASFFSASETSTRK